MFLNKECNCEFANTHSSHWGFFNGSEVKNLPANVGDAGDTGSVPGLGKSPGRGNGNSLWYSCLESPMDGETWWTAVRGIAKESDIA